MHAACQRRTYTHLSASDCRDRFALKGGFQVTSRSADTDRFTGDIDFLAFGSDEMAEFAAASLAILAIDGVHGLVGMQVVDFDVDDGQLVVFKNAKGPRVGAKGPRVGGDLSP